MLATLTGSGGAIDKPPGFSGNLLAGIPDPGESFMGRLFSLELGTPGESRVRPAETRAVLAHIGEAMGDLAITSPTPSVLPGSTS